MIFAVRQIQEKCQEQNQDLYMVFVDLTKAFDTVNRDGLWKILLKLGCPDKFVSLIRSFHEGMLQRSCQNHHSSNRPSNRNASKNPNTTPVTSGYLIQTQRHVIH